MAEGQEALIPEGDTRATLDADVAAELATRRVKELENRKRNKVILGMDRQSGLADYAASDLRLKAEGNEAVHSWMVQTERQLRLAFELFGSDIDLAAISPEDVTRWVGHLRTQDNGRGGTLGETSVRKHINSLSNLYRRATSERYVTSNPVADLYSKPAEEKGEAAYLQPEEAALLLESARTYRALIEPKRQDHGGTISAKPNPHIFPILATFLLTGGRKSEVLGLEVDDVSFRLGRIYFRSNEWRRLKTRESKRSVPLWPQLREILEAYMIVRDREGGESSLVFPSVGGRPRRASNGESSARMVHDLRKVLDTIGTRARMPPGYVRLHMLRHTYTAARIQTLGRGAPVSLYTVARELGHASTDMIEERYGHLHDRTILGGSEGVEFRVESYREKLGELLSALHK